MALKIVNEEGVLILKTIAKTLPVENVADLVKECKKVANKKRCEGPCEVFYAGYECLIKNANIQ